MIALTTLAEMLETGLNNNASNIGFKIHVNAGEYKASKRNQFGKVEKPLINAILKTLTGSFVPVKNLENYYTTLSMEMLVPESKLEDVENILRNLIQLSIGDSQSIDGYSVFINFDIPTVGNLQNASPLGSCTPVQTLVYFNFVKHGMFANDVKITIDGEEMVVLDKSITKIRACEQRAILNEKNVKSSAQTQALAFEILIPYLKSVTTKKIVNDILNGNLTVTYEVTYNDGFADTITKTCIITQGNIAGQPSTVASVRITLMEI